MKKISLTLLIAFVLFGGLAGLASAQSKPDCGLTNSSADCYQQLSPIQDPNGGPVKTDNFPAYLQAIYRIGIGACFVLGVIMFTWAGIEYILSEAMNTKKDAQNRMQNALIGLAIALVSYILLNTINPDLLKFTSLNTSTTKTPTITPVTPAGPNQ